MQTEYLITFDSKDDICTSVDKFKSLLSAHTSMSFGKKEKLSYNGNDFTYKLAQGTLTDSSIYYDLTIEDTDTTDQESYKEMLKEVRRICSKISGRNIIILHDGIGEFYCQAGYPTIYKTENLMRKLIAKFMAISIGYDWSDASTPKEVLESVRSENKKEKTNFLHEIDFIQLSNFLFKKYSKTDSNRFIESLKGKDDDDVIKIGDIKQYQPFTNWEKFFAKKVQCDSEYLKSKWEKLYEYRCKIAHCKGLTKIEYDDLLTISDDLCEKIQAALDAIGDVHIEEADRDELAENFSGTASKSAADFIAKYNKLTNLTQMACELSSNEQDIYGKYDTNKTNIRMQSKYLWTAKGIISKELSHQINKAQDFRNLVVHKVGIMDISDAEINEEMAAIDEIIEILSSIKPEDLKQLQGVDLRSKPSENDPLPT